MPSNANTKLRPYLNAPHPDDTQNVAQFYDWLVTSMNTLIGQQVPPALGVSGLSPGVINPTTAALLSSGGRVGSLTTNFGFTAPSTTSVNIFWDGTNQSTILRIYRDDGSVAGPFPGSQLVTGLLASTTYFFYPYFDEATQRVLFVSQGGASGSPPIAYTKAAIAVAQQQILRGRIPLASDLAVTGITTPASGTTAATNTGGGGGNVGVFLGRKLSQ
jgi:hypothetical protein